MTVLAPKAAAQLSLPILPPLTNPARQRKMLGPQYHTAVQGNTVFVSGSRLSFYTRQISKKLILIIDCFPASTIFLNPHKDRKKSAEALRHQNEIKLTLASCLLCALGSSVPCPSVRLVRLFMPLRLTFAASGGSKRGNGTALYF